MFNKKELKKIMDKHQDYNKDLAAYLGMSVPIFRPSGMVGSSLT